MIDLKFLIELNIIMAILGLVYLLIRNRISVIAGRIMLVFIPIMAFGATFFKHSSVGEAASIQVPMFVLDEVDVNANSAMASGFELTWGTLFATISLILLLILFVRTLRIFFQFRKAKPLASHKGIKVLCTDKKSSFSFFNLIHLNKDLEQEEKEVVLEHEILHYENLHSLDMILMEIYHALFWYNPIFILLKRELVQIHEYEVDKVMFRRHSASYMKHLLAHSLGASVAHLLLTSQFKSKSTLAKRIKNMKKNRISNKFALAVIPALVIALSLISWTDVTKSSYATSIFTPEFTNTTETTGSDSENPQYVGGQEALIEFISTNIKYPEEAEKNGWETTVYVTFNVMENGEVTKVKAETSSPAEYQVLSDEAVRVVSIMPNWNPAVRDGKPVATRGTLPIKFELAD